MKRYWLVKLRKNRNLTQAEIAELIHIDRAYYSQVESGLRNPSEEISRSIGRVLNIDPLLLFSDTNAFQDAFFQTRSILAHSDLDLRYTWVYNPTGMEKVQHFIGARDDELNYTIDAKKILNLKQKVIDTQKTISIYDSCFHNGESYNYCFIGYPLVDQSGVLIGVGTIAMRMDNMAMEE
ncbi:helix-turn-helix domain-containing protein [Bacillus infantis]|uniref:Helix-turn-helix transcriptional regulator n=1 Tax=Bacillus infantis TaxID=324767 RepID=A0A5D4R9L8_9BACI|nr:helix-turn-helix transcriptional regulator [Bacillus infantis]TYS46714.1 helix-turn-helix transcriptional regulator [Bacillus infantis]